MLSDRADDVDVVHAVRREEGIVSFCAAGIMNGNAPEGEA